MKFRDFVILINVAVTLGLLLELFLGKPVVIVIVSGVFLYLLVNLILLYRMKKEKR